ncbi:glycosyltransferase family 39 protein [Dyadobacter flavalbus]|uniref:Glycosyltransferase family 39 protein n=1 Tax=Dyadobacter flavalbus TaxID=2579942 RepID=A0A5M8QRZ8_9BACT|nr:glycosyltransferase family 39 protein [Dyadobacter flavalbus]KAA6438985.1 glycosyltransferase family 39 protein [Dyadobacter flavalbus]
MNKRTLILSLFVIVKLVLHYLIIAPGYDLHRDEYLHLDQGKHLAWGYLSVPPFTSWNSFIILQSGNSEFWVRFFPAMYGALTLVVIWKTIGLLGGNVFALILGATAITFSALLRMNMLFQPNSVDILGWTLFYYSVLYYLKTDRNKWLYIAAIVFGFSFLNKYNIVFLVAGLVPALWITNHRKLFYNKHLYTAAFTALLIISPNLIWQFQNNFPVIHHMKLLAETQLVNVSRPGFLKEQLLFFTASLFIILAAFISFFIYPPFKKYQVFFWSFVFTLTLFIYLRAKSYYAVGLYPVFIAFGSVYLEKVFIKRLLWLRPASVIFILILFIPMFRVAFPIKDPSAIASDSTLFKKLGLLRWEDGKDHKLPQDYADMLGWRELAQIVDSSYAEISDKKHTLVLCDNYGQAGAINYYSRFRNIGAVTMNADYINWFPLQEEVKNIILVQSADDDDKSREKEKPLFENIFLVGKIRNQYARECGTSVYVLLDAKVSINKILKSDMEENKWD